MKRAESELVSILNEMLNIKGMVYGKYGDTDYDEDYLDDIIEQLDTATDAVRGAIALM